MDLLSTVSQPTLVEECFETPLLHQLNFHHILSVETPLLKVHSTSLHWDFSEALCNSCFTDCEQLVNSPVAPACNQISAVT